MESLVLSRVHIEVIELGNEISASMQPNLENTKDFSL